MDRNVRLLVCYDGTNFHGWQAQPGLRTIQTVVEDALRRVLRHPITLIASGRTDAGVHAAGQVANFRTSHPMPAERLCRALNGRLPVDVRIRAAQDVSAEFHATRDAVAKLYRYRINDSPTGPDDDLTQRYALHRDDALDDRAMAAAARHFVGTMDFTSMAPASCRRETMVRTVRRCEIERHVDELRIDVEGTGFLYNQVRNMVGTLIEVARGHWLPERVAGILDGRDRSLAGPTAPAHGLCLRWVRYPPGVLRPGCE